MKTTFTSSPNFVLVLRLKTTQISSVRIQRNRKQFSSKKSFLAFSRVLNTYMGVKLSMWTLSPVTSNNFVLCKINLFLANIILSRRLLPVILDFGLSFDEERRVHQPTFAGSPFYLAPEVCFI